MSTFIPLLLACATAQSADPPAAAPATIEAAAERALVGQRPAEAKPAVSFSGVLGLDGTPRTPEDLRGKPTVMWFYPMAGTPG